MPVFSPARTGKPLVDRNLDQLQTKIVQLSTAVQGPTWTALTPTNGWSWFGPDAVNGDFAMPGYFQDSAGWVWLKGFLKGGGVNKLLFSERLPAPREQQNLGVLTNDGGSVEVLGRVDIHTNGACFFISGGNSYLSLDGIRYPTT